MDKYEYKLKLEQLKNLVEEKDYKTAAEIADTINWRKVKSSSTLCMVGEIYDRNKQYENSRDILLMAYDRATVGRNIIYRLALVSLKMGRLEEAKEYYDEFLEIAPYDNLKYVLRYQIAKIEGASLEEQIAILEEFKSREYMEEWAFELAYLYHRSGNGGKCVEVCDELVLWFGDGKYVEKALELKMLYQPLNKEQEEKYREFKTHQDGGLEVQPAELMESGKIIQDTVRIPDLTASSGRFNTLNLQEELAKGMQQIMEADTKETLSDTMDNIKKIVDEIPYLKVPQEEGEGKAEEERYGHIETDEEIDDSLETDFQELLAEDWDGQISFAVPGGDWWEPQVNGQIRIEEVLAEWEKTKHAAEAAMAVAQQRKLESAKARALQEAEELMERLNQIIPKLNAGITPQELLAERYLQNAQLEGAYAGEFSPEDAGMEDMGGGMGAQADGMPGMPAGIDPATGMPLEGMAGMEGMPMGIDPATGMPLEGMAGMEGTPMGIDPATGMPLEGMAGMEGTPMGIDPATGMPLEGMAGMPEVPAGIDPATGMPLEGMVHPSAGNPQMEETGWGGYPANLMGAYPENPFLGNGRSGIQQFRGNNFGELAMQMSQTGRFEQDIYGMSAMDTIMPGPDRFQTGQLMPEVPQTGQAGSGMFQEGYPMPEPLQSQGELEIGQGEPELFQTGWEESETFQAGQPMPEVPKAEEPILEAPPTGQPELELPQAEGSILEAPPTGQPMPEAPQAEEPILEASQTGQPEQELPQSGQEWEISQTGQPMPEPEEFMDLSGQGAQGQPVGTMPETGAQGISQTTGSMPEAGIQGISQTTGSMQQPDGTVIPQITKPLQEVPQAASPMQGMYTQGIGPMQRPYPRRMPQVTAPMQGGNPQGMPQATAPMQGGYPQGMPQATVPMQGGYPQGMPQGTGWAQGMPQRTGPIQGMYAQGIPQGAGSIQCPVGTGIPQATAPIQGEYPQGAGWAQGAYPQRMPQAELPAQDMAAAGELSQEAPRTEEMQNASRPTPQWEGEGQAGSGEPEGQQAQEPPKPKKKDAEEYLESVFQAAKASREEKNQVSTPVLESEPKPDPSGAGQDLDGMGMGTAPMKAGWNSPGAGVPKAPQRPQEAFAMPEIEVLPEQETGRKLTEEEREIFSYFVPVNGMEQQLCQVLEGALHRRGKNSTSATGNILIMGGRGSGKTVLATDLIKVLQKKDGPTPGKVGKITGDSLNQKDLSQLLKKVAGGYLIIEKAGELTQETVTRLSLLMEQNTEGLLFLLEDTRKGIEKALGMDLNFAKKFTERIKIPVFTSDELVEFAKAYADEQECEIDDMGILALYNRISNIQKLDEATTLSEVKEIVDLAISSAERGGLKKLFGGKKFSPEGYLYLREKDFEE